MTRDLNRVALTLVSDGKGILAAGETVLTFSTSCIYVPTINSAASPGRHGGDGEHASQRRQSAASPRMARRLIETTSKE
jgi:hypothetical protein